MVSEKSLEQRVGILTGPTAAGKSSFSLELAQTIEKSLAPRQLEIINADSILVYRTANIGSAKPTQEERNRTPHHLIDIKDPDEPYSVGNFHRDTSRLISEIHSRGNRALIVGGTGFYIKALLYGLWDVKDLDLKIRTRLEQEENAELYKTLEEIEPELALKIGINDRYRLMRSLEVYYQFGKTPTQLEQEMPKEPNPQFSLWVIDREKEDLKAILSQRTHSMVESGLVEETEEIRSKFPKSKILSSVGYKQVCRYLDGILPQGRKIPPGLPGLEEEINLATRQLVKSQRTWFRGEKASQFFLLDRDKDRLKKVFLELYTERASQ